MKHHGTPGYLGGTMRKEYNLLGSSHETMEYHGTPGYLGGTMRKEYNLLE